MNLLETDELFFFGLATTAAVKKQKNKHQTKDNEKHNDTKQHKKQKKKQITK